MPMGKYAKSAISLLIVGGTAMVISGGITILYSVQRNSIYTSSYPEGSRKHVLKPSDYGMPHTHDILTTQDNVKIRIYVCKRHTDREASSRPTVLMFHVSIMI
jgi:hypothetical protein